MRSRAVRTFTLLLAALFLAVAALFGWIANRPRAERQPPVTGPGAAPAETARGAELFETFCSSCHTPDALRSIARGRTDLARTRVEMERFLATHGGAAVEQNRAIVAYLIKDK
jgi:mono/diheme cytochrome c family protein